MKLEKVYSALNSSSNGHAGAHAYTWSNSPDKYANGFTSCHVWMSFEKSQYLKG